MKNTINTKEKTKIKLNWQKVMALILSVVLTLSLAITGLSIIFG